MKLCGCGCICLQLLVSWYIYCIRFLLFWFQVQGIIRLETTDKDPC